MALNKPCMRRVPLTSSRRIPFILLLLAFPTTVHAHIELTVTDGIWDGMLHPLVTPMHLLMILALGFMAGRQPWRELKVPWFIFLSVSAIALALTNTGWIRQVYPPLFVGLALIMGTFLALEKSPPNWANCALFGLTAGALGLDSLVEAEIKSWIVKWQLGNWLCVNLLVFDIAFYVDAGWKQKWLKIALRVAGSWLIAISLMILAFSFRR
jgi:urease accessory protein